MINLNLKSTIDRYIYLNGFYDRDKINFFENEIDLHTERELQERNDYE